MVVSSELLTVVTPAHQVPPAASVPVIDPSITSTVTVPLALPARLLRSAAPPPVIVPAPAPLARGRSQGGPWHYHWGLGGGQVLGQVTAVVLIVVVGPELLTVVTPAHQVPRHPLCPSLTPPSPGP